MTQISYFQPQKLRPWPAPPQLAGDIYRIESPHWSGNIKVTRIMIDNYGEDRAVRFTVWGFLLKTHADREKWQALFDKHGRHETRKAFIESVCYEKIEAAV